MSVDSSDIFSAGSLNGLYKYAYSLCLNPDDAYDLLHSSLEKYLARQSSSNSPSSIEHKEAYIRTMIRNRFIDSQRYDQRWKMESFIEQEDYDISPLDLESWVVHQQQFTAVWLSLSAADRDALFHWVILGHSTDEVCEILKIPRGTFLSRMHRLKKRLQNDANLNIARGAANE